MTGSPEMLGGRVKTLHPKIHGGILADRSKPEHLDDLATNGIEAIDLVVSNLYPFSSDPSVELIDIGGPAMVRAAAKNHEHVGIVTSPADYPVVLEELRAAGSLSAATRRRLARAAFAHTAAYDAAIVAWLDAGGPDPGRRPRRRHRRRRRGGRRCPPSCRRRCTSRSSAPRCCATARTRTSAGSRYRIGGHGELVGRHGPARRAARCPTSTSSTATRPGGWSTSWRRTPEPGRPPWPSSSTPTRAAPPWPATSSPPTSGRSSATR